MTLYMDGDEVQSPIQPFRLLWRQLLLSTITFQLFPLILVNVWKIAILLQSFFSSYCQNAHLMTNM